MYHEISNAHLMLWIQLTAASPCLQGKLILPYLLDVIHSLNMTV